MNETIYKIHNKKLKPLIRISKVIQVREKMKIKKTIVHRFDYCFYFIL